MTSHSGQYQCAVNNKHIDISYEDTYLKSYIIDTYSKYYCIIYI